MTKLEALDDFERLVLAEIDAALEEPARPRTKTSIEAGATALRLHHIILALREHDYPAAQKLLNDIMSYSYWCARDEVIEAIKARIPTGTQTTQITPPADAAGHIVWIKGKAYLASRYG